jgi:diguanylate cyclase (GGDEF)-like protein
MDNIVQGLAMFNRNGGLIVCNRRYAEIYGLPLHLANQRGKAATSPAASDLGRFGKPIDQPRKERDGSMLVLSRLPDGRLIAQRKKTLAEGGWVSTHEDITAHREAEDKIRAMATHDALTGLLNRFGFRQRLEQCLAEAQRRTGRFALLYLDLDRFKRVNDTSGHPVGDKLLQAVAGRMAGVVRKSDATARLGGDEFAVIQRISVAPRDSMRLAERLIAAVAQPYDIDGLRIEIGTSVGIALTPDDSVDADEILRLADLALYHSKADRGSYHFFQTGMDQEFRSKRQLEDDLKTALAEGQFEVHFQPIVSVVDRRVTAFEALLRWTHPVRGPVSPSEFIPVAEETGLIVAIGEWAMRVACKEATRWPPPIGVAVNVSAIQFRTPAFAQTVFDALESTGLPGSRLILELTESVMMKDSDATIATLETIRAKGVRTSMDDFGTGYSSLSYVRRLPFDQIKIDKTFIDELGVRDDTTAIVRAAVALAQALGMQTVAEGIEREEQLARVRAEGITEAQGYLTGRPMPARQALTFLGVEPVGEDGQKAASRAPAADAEVSDGRAASNVTAFKPRSTANPPARASSTGLRPASRT